MPQTIPGWPPPVKEKLLRVECERDTLKDKPIFDLIAPMEKVKLK